jgi:hypothetical protein
VVAPGSVPVVASSSAPNAVGVADNGIQAVVSTDPSVVCPMLCKSLGIHINIIKGTSKAEPRGLIVDTWRAVTTNEGPALHVEHSECRCEQALYKEDSPLMGVTLRVYRHKDSGLNHFEPVLPTSTRGKAGEGEGVKLNVPGSKSVVKTKLLEIYNEWLKVSPLVAVSSPSVAVSSMATSSKVAVSSKRKSFQWGETTTINITSGDNDGNSNAEKELNEIGLSEPVHN